VIFLVLSIVLATDDSCPWLNELSGYVDNVVKVAGHQGELFRVRPAILTTNVVSR
jgi:hypothetical protein